MYLYTLLCFGASIKEGFMHLFIRRKTAGSEDGAYRFFEDAGHGWLEVPRREVVASGANISRYSYYDPKTDMVYLEEDCDAISFLEASGKGLNWPTTTMRNSMPRRLPAYKQVKASGAGGSI
jgi:hypothetical protein